VRALVSAELLKLRTTRAWIGYVVALFLLSGIAAASLAGGAAAFEIDSPEYQRDLVSTSVSAGFIALLVGITLVTVEWRHGTVTRTILVTPRRARVLVAKQIAGFLVGVVLAVLAVVVVLAVAIPVLSGEGGGFVLDAAMMGRIGWVVLAAALAGAFGVGVGALLKSQTFALVAAIVWTLVLEPLLRALLELAEREGAADFLPGQALGALDGSVEDALSPAAGGIVGLAYVVGFGVLGWLRLERSDIT